MQECKGDCFSNAVSIVVDGDDSLSGVLCEATTKMLTKKRSHLALLAAEKCIKKTIDDLFPNTMARSSQAVFDDTEGRNKAIAAETERQKRTKNGVPWWLYLDLQRIIKCPIFSIYSDVSYNLCSLFHQIILPTETLCEEPVMFCRQLKMWFLILIRNFI